MTKKRKRMKNLKKRMTKESREPDAFSMSLLLKNLPIGTKTRTTTTTTTTTAITTTAITTTAMNERKKELGEKNTHLQPSARKIFSRYVWRKRG